MNHTHQRFHADAFIYVYCIYILSTAGRLKANENTFRLVLYVPSKALAQATGLTGQSSASGKHSAEKITSFRV